jgi:hypothetical protein
MMEKAEPVSTRKKAVCRSACDIEEMTRRTTEIAPWQPCFLAKSNLLPIVDLLSEFGVVKTHGCL